MAADASRRHHQWVERVANCRRLVDILAPSETFGPAAVRLFFYLHQEMRLLQRGGTSRRVEVDGLKFFVTERFPAFEKSLREHHGAILREVVSRFHQRLSLEQHVECLLDYAELKAMGGLVGMSIADLPAEQMRKLVKGLAKGGERYRPVLSCVANWERELGIKALEKNVMAEVRMGQVGERVLGDLVDILFKELRVDHTIEEVSEARDILGRILYEDLVPIGPTGTPRREFVSGGQSIFNMIPGCKAPAGRPVLLVKLDNSQHFARRISDAVAHVIECRRSDNPNRVLVFIAKFWDNEEFDLLRRPLVALNIPLVLVLRAGSDYSICRIA